MLRFLNQEIIDMRGTNKTFLEIWNNSLNGNYAIVKKTLEKDGCKYINDRNAQNNGWSALHAAASNDHTGVMELLIANGIKIDDQDDSGNTALHIAAHNGCKNAVTLLLKSGASTIIKNGSDKTAFECIEDERIKDKMSDLFIINRSNRQGL